MSVTDTNLVDEIVDHQFNCLHILYAFVASFIVYLAWCSTYVRDYTQLDLNRRRTLFILNPQTGVFERHPIALQTQGDSTANAATTTDANSTGPATESDIDGSNIVRLPAPPPSLESILDEVSGFTTGVHYNNTPADTIDVELVDEEAQAIIREMDNGVHTQEGVRQRRLAFFQNMADNNSSSNSTAASASTSATPATTASTIETHSTTSVAATVTATPTASSTGDDPVAKANEKCDDEIAAVATNTVESSSNNTASSSDHDAVHEYGDELTIKLKYLNDDLKIVKGRPSELIGDFKK